MWEVRRNGEICAEYSTPKKKKKGQAHSLAIIHLAICPNHSVAVV